MVAEFFTEYGFTLLFYVVLIAVIYWQRKRFEWQGKFLGISFVGLLKTKVGLKLMDRLGKHEKFFKFLGYTGILIGFLGMIFIIYQLVYGLYTFFMIPGAPPVVSPVFPGAKIPGLGIKVPLIIGWLALFIVIVVHEFSHGVVARAHKMKVKSSGLMVFGPIGGAFVEPDEKQLTKSKKSAQLSVFAAGPFSNILLAILAQVIILFLLFPLVTGFIANNGVVFKEVQQGYGAYDAGVQAGVVYDSLNNISFNNNKEFFSTIDSLNLTPGENVTLTSLQGDSYNILLSENPQNTSKGYLGVILGNNIRKTSFLGNIFYKTLLFFVELFTWVFLLSLGIGLANLLPLGPVDGGRMLLIALESFFEEKRAKLIWAKISILVVLVLVVLLFGPLVKWIWAMTI